MPGRCIRLPCYVRSCAKGLTSELPGEGPGIECGRLFPDQVFITSESNVIKSNI